MIDVHMQIGEVAERVQLSLRTIRYYDEVGVVTPSARSKGGFRLYTNADVARLELVKCMKPLDFSLDEMRDSLSLLDAWSEAQNAPEQREALLERLTAYREAVAKRMVTLRKQMTAAQRFTQQLDERLQQHVSTAASERS